VLLEPAWVKAAAKRFHKQGYFLEDVTCLDHEEGLVVLYHFDHYDNPGRVTVRVARQPPRTLHRRHLPRRGVA